MQFMVRGPVPVLAAALALSAAAPAWAASTEDTARNYVATHADRFGVLGSDVTDLSVMSSYKTSGTGVTHVSLTQRREGFDVFGSQATVNVGRDGRVVFSGGSLVKGIKAGSTSASLDAADAVAAAAKGLGLDAPGALKVTRAAAGKSGFAKLSDGGISDSPIEAKLGWQPSADGQLRLAWQVHIDVSADSSLWSATVDARSGALLESEDLTVHEDTDEIAGRLARQTISKNFAPPAFVLLTPDPVNDGSSYNVFAFPTESPNDADRTLVTNPADRPGSPFGWHDTDGVAGPEFTTTQGNNVHAYMDQDTSNTPDFGSSPDGGAALKFDFPMDLDEHAQAYRDAATANLFYGNNMLHDIMYRFGFDEASGNFQANNYGKGGVGTDYVRAEAADGNGTNNANFSTPVNDGGTPRMQMYLWPGAQLGLPNTVSITGGATYTASYARYTPPATVAGLTGTYVYVGTGCGAAQYPATPPAGTWIAVADGGTAAAQCAYLLRTQLAEAAGAKALVIAHNATGTAPTLTGSMATAPVTIPAVAVSQADGVALKAAIAAGTTTGTVKKNPDHPGIRDGDLDHGIILHEYTHGISSRLTGGVGNSCLGGNEQAGEGWSDYIAMTLMMDLSIDHPDLPRGLVPYTLFQADRHGNGLRPRPYTTDMSVQPFTYDSIKTNGWLNSTSLALPHGLGHGWTSVLWDMNWALIEKYGFNRNLYASWNTGGNLRGVQYVTDGLKMQGCNPGLVVARAAIIAAAEVRNNGPADTCTLWSAFARRGLGYSAVQGTTNRDDNTEAFDTHPSCLRGFDNVPAGPAITTVVSGTEVPLKFTVDAGLSGLDIATKDNPYSRQVDCQTLKTVTPGQVAITPRPIPVEAVTAAGKALSVDAGGTYTYPWQTTTAWGDSCRELVFTTKTGVQHRSYFKFLAATHVDGSAGGTVPATLSLSLGAPATFGAFVPGSEREYTAQTTANVISTAGEATLSVSEPGHLANGAFTLPEPLRVSFSKTSWSAPTSNENVDIGFRQLVKATDALRTGMYSKTLTLTLSTTTP